MSTYDKRLDALERDVAVMKQDIIYKLDDTNSAVTITKGVMGALAQDVKLMSSRIKTMEIQLDKIDIEIAEVRRDVHTLEQSMDKKFDQVLLMLSKLTSGSEQET